MNGLLELIAIEETEKIASTSRIKNHTNLIIDAEILPQRQEIIFSSFLIIGNKPIIPTMSGTIYSLELNITALSINRFPFKPNKFRK